MLFDVDKNKCVMQIDSTDRLINKIPKIEAHLKGIRHKTFSVLILYLFPSCLIFARTSFATFVLTSIVDDDELPIYT